MFNLIANGKGGRGFKFTPDNVTIVFDGNSIGWGEGSTYATFSGSNGGQLGAYTVGQMPFFKESGIRPQGFAVPARNITTMITNIAQVRQLYNPKKFNLLIVDEITNEMTSNAGLVSARVSAVLAKILQYNNAARSGGQNWFIMWLTAIPRGVSTTLNDATHQSNQVLQQVNQALRDNPALYGVDRVVDRCWAGDGTPSNPPSPFRQFTNFTQAEYDAQAKYYRSRERSAANGGTYTFTANCTAGNVNLTNVVPTEASKANDAYPYLFGGGQVTSTAITGGGALSIAANGVFDALVRLTASTNLTTQVGATFNMTHTSFTNLHTHPSDLGYAIGFNELERELRLIGDKVIIY